jgi:hypothetical protein
MGKVYEAWLTQLPLNMVLRLKYFQGLFYQVGLPRGEKTMHQTSQFEKTTQLSLYFL